MRAAWQEGEQALGVALAGAEADADPASRERLPEVAREIALCALIGLADGRLGEDLPRLIQRPPHRLEGREVPGNRGLHDNPDTCYRLVPLDGRSDFLLEGDAGPAPATIFEASALSDGWRTLGHVTRRELGIAPGRRFRIRCHPAEVRPAPQDGEADATIALDPDAEMLLLRETLADWSRERPARLSIRSFVDRGGPRDRDDDAYHAEAARRVGKWFAEAIRLTELPHNQPANTFPKPVISGEHGKLVTMAYSIGHFRVPPGQALVLRIDPGPAAYVGVPITNLWGTTNGNLARAASWNSAQADRLPDGRFECVLSQEDPGAHNWLDPDGLECGFLFLRWAGLDAGASTPRVPDVESRLVPIGALRETLAPQTRWLSAEERAEELDRLARDHARRYEALDEDA